MAMLGYFLALIVVYAAAAEKCPFNPSECDCLAPVSEHEFNEATCESRNGKIPKFNGSHAYTISDLFNLTFDAYSIDNDAFKAFKLIGRLNLNQPRGHSVPHQKWQAHAFRGPSIGGISVHNVAGVLPPPAALQEIGKNLTFLEVDHDDPVTLTSKAFSKDNKLRDLTIEDTQITRIDEEAFAGLEKTLYSLTLINASLKAVPAKALQRLDKLNILDLADNRIRDFAENDFSKLENLSVLRLTGNDIQAAVDSGALEHFPKSLNLLWLDRSHPPLERIPRTVLQHEAAFSLVLQDNHITAVREAEIPDDSMVTFLDLDGNPIDQIEKDTLGKMRRLTALGLSRTNLSSFDLADLDRADDIEILYLEETHRLKRLEVGDLEKVPKRKFTLINLDNSGVEVVGREFDELLTRAPSLKLLIKNTRLDCDEDIEWMAKRALCLPVRIYIDDAKCKKDGQSLKKYLEDLAPHACLETTTRHHFTTEPTHHHETTTHSSSGQCDVTVTCNCNCRDREL